ncbi:MAG TPA: L,D-transpeptidase [Devosia sp.]|nr:L,D-transpeptidase [Devosia sp.]
MSLWRRAIKAAVATALALSLVITPASAAGRSIFDFRPFQDHQVQSERPARQVKRSGKVRIDPKFKRQIVAYKGGEAPGTIIVNTGQKFLYLVTGKGKAIRYGIGTARDGFEWSGTHRLSSKKEWPGWTPPAEMKKRQPGLPDYMPGGPNNPLGARALYIGSTLYRIHGTNEPWSIGMDVSSGCIRMVNDDVIDLYERARVGAKVIVL